MFKRNGKMKPELPLLGLLFGLMLLTAACAPNVVATPAIMPPVSIQELASPTATPSPLQGKSLTVGFNIRGWT